MSRNSPRGQIRYCEMQMESPGFARHWKRSGRRRAGELYEQRVHAEFLVRYPGYLPSPWFRFCDAEGDKWCQPDGLLINPWQGTISVVECKYQHTDQAYHQLFTVYKPVVEHLFGGLYKVALVEVVKWFDPAVHCPVAPHLCKDPATAVAGRFNVHIWKP